MNPKVCSIGYLPPPSFGCTVPFYRNVMSFETHYPLVLYSDDKTWPAEVIRLKASPEFIRGAKYPNGVVNTWAIANLAFWTGVAIACDHGYTHMICLEADCRIRGNEWDKIMFDEFLAAGEGKLIGGSVVTYSPCNRNVQFALRWRDFLVRHAFHQFPIPSYGGGGSAEQKEQAVLVNGALGIYDLAWLKSIGPAAREKTTEFCEKTTAWDYYVGRKLVEKYGAEAFNYVVHLDCVYSGYGDVFFTEQERIKLLTDGKVVGVHQVKSNWTLVGNVAETADARSAGTSAHGSSGIDHNRRSAVDTNAGSNPAIAPILETPDGGNRPLPDSPRDSSAIQGHGANESPTAKADVAPAESGASSPVVNPRVSLFICTHLRDKAYLEYCLLSIEKFARGFWSTIIVLPQQELDAFSDVIAKFEPPHYLFATFDEAPRARGHLQQMAVKCMADTFDPEADYFAFVDSDCIFEEPVTPADYFHNDCSVCKGEGIIRNDQSAQGWDDCPHCIYRLGKPVLLMESYESLRQKQDGATCWQQSVCAALGWPSENEFMRRHPAVHHRDLLIDLRKHIEMTHKQSFLDYVMSRKETFPYGFCEFNTMGEFAWHLRRTSYHWIDLEKQPRPHRKLLQFWSHSPVDKPQDLNNDGFVAKGIVPLTEIKRILGI